MEYNIQQWGTDLWLGFVCSETTLWMLVLSTSSDNHYGLAKFWE